MKRNIYKRLEELERANAAALQTRASDIAGQSAKEWLRALEISYGIEQLNGESRMDALARTFGISSRELKDRLERRCSEPDEADNPGCAG